MALSSVSGESMEMADKLKRSERFKITNRLVAGSILCLFSWMLLLIAFACRLASVGLRAVFRS